MGTALELPPISTEQLAAVESAALRFGLARAHLVEAAARAAAALARRLLDNQLEGATAVALADAGLVLEARGARRRRPLHPERAGPAPLTGFS